MSEISIYDPAMLVWVDEKGCDQRNNMRKYGYSVWGIPLASFPGLAHLSIAV